MTNWEACLLEDICRTQCCPCTISHCRASLHGDCIHKSEEWIDSPGHHDENENDDNLCSIPEGDEEHLSF